MTVAGPQDTAEAAAAGVASLKVNLSEVVIPYDDRMTYLAMPTSGDIDGPPLLCDPVTSLVAYPSFEQHLIARLDHLIPLGLHLAIGDVDDLRLHVLVRRATDPTSFGHLAGNECMRSVGLITSGWAATSLTDWPFALCGTFGGDEVIVAAAGLQHEEFVELVRELATRLRNCAPRPSSFAIGTFHSPSLPADANAVYRAFVSTVDIALFDLKAERRAAGMAPYGDLVDIGSIEVSELLERHRLMGLKGCAT